MVIVSELAYRGCAWFATKKVPCPMSGHGMKYAYCASKITCFLCSAGTPLTVNFDL